MLWQKYNSADEIFFNSCFTLAAKSLIGQVTLSLKNDSNFFLLTFYPVGIQQCCVKLLSVSLSANGVYFSRHCSTMTYPIDAWRASFLLWKVLMHNIWISKNTSYLCLKCGISFFFFWCPIVGLKMMLSYNRHYIAIQKCSVA